MGARPGGSLRCAVLLVGVLSFAVAEACSACSGGEGEVGPRVDVRFLVGTPLDDPLRLLPAPMRASVVKVAPLVNPEAAARLNAERMARWFRLELKPDTRVLEFVAALAALEVVEVAEAVPESAPDPRS